MTTVDVLLVNCTSGELDRMPLEVRDREDCGREVLAAVTRQNWVLSVGDRIEVVGRGEPGSVTV